MITCIVCAVDGSEHSDKAVELACDLAARYEARLHLLHVYMKGMTLSELQSFSENAHLKDLVQQESEVLASLVATNAGAVYAAYVPPPSEKVVTRVAEVVLEDARQVAEAKGVKNVTVVAADGAPAHKIVEYAAENDADMIVMGTRGLGTLAGVFVGSTSQKVCHTAECTCITVK